MALTTKRTSIGMDGDWYANHDNVVALGHWLNDRGDFSAPADAIRYFESPWKWGDEWAHRQFHEDNSVDAEAWAEEKGCLACFRSQHIVPTLDTGADAEDCLCEKSGEHAFGRSCAACRAAFAAKFPGVKVLEVVP